MFQVAKNTDIRKPREKTDSNRELSKRNPQAEQAMAQHQAAIYRCHIDPDFCYQPEILIKQKITWLAQHCNCVLDVGQSSRDHSALFKPQQLITIDVNQNSSSPVDIVDDICAPTRLVDNSYDGIVCLSVLEHVYDPFSAAQNLHALLKPATTFSCTCRLFFDTTQTRAMNSTIATVLVAMALPGC